ncbi:MAG TPA: VIT domain-containing protein [Gemmatimonadales bacterium]|nr:VIT domain-containing protein [Gemmatimonadales bacterium]
MRVMALVSILAGFPAICTAQGWIERERPVTVTQPRNGVIRVSSAVRVDLDGRIARFEVEERFRNDGGGLAEGTYIYPLPADAAFSDFSLFQGDQELRGEMMNAEQVRGIYEEIVRKQRDPALLTLAGHGLIRAQVFPIQPGETRRVILRYSQLLSRDGDAFKLRYALGSRGDVPVTIALTARDAERYGVPYSPTHRVEWKADRGRLTVRSECDPRGEFQLLLPVRRGLIGTTVVTHAPGGADRFAMLVVSPPMVSSEMVIPRDLTLVVDVSGSMSGGKMEQARAALNQALGSLRAADRFRVIAFSSGVTEFATGWTPATSAQVGRAHEFVDNLEARGGTNIEGALNAALGARIDPSRMGIVLFMTDGLPSVGEQAPEKIAAAAAAQRQNFRIFPIGVGHDVNTYLLDRLAVEGKGRVEYVAPDASVETALGQVLSRIDAPVLSDIRIVQSPVRLLDRVPADLPDLFSGEELVVFARYAGEASGEIILEGSRNGRRERFSAPVRFPEHETANAWVAPLWASQRIGELTRQARLEGGSQALISEIKALGLRYGIITEYTSYLVQEPTRPQLAREGQVRLEEVVATGTAAQAAAPAAQSGADAFRRAEKSARMADAKNVAEAEAAANLNVPKDERSLKSKRVGGRLFVERDAVWTDAGHTGTVQVVDVAPFSPAWFALTRALPEIVPWLSAGESVLVAGKGVSIRVGAKGLEEWKPGQLEKLTRDFRGA